MIVSAHWRGHRIPLGIHFLQLRHECTTRNVIVLWTVKCSLSSTSRLHSPMHFTISLVICYIAGLVQDCSNSSALAMELLQSCTKPSIYSQPYLPSWSSNLTFTLLFWTMLPCGSLSVQSQLKWLELQSPVENRSLGTLENWVIWNFCDCPINFCNEDVIENSCCFGNMRCWNFIDNPCAKNNDCLVFDEPQRYLLGAAFSGAVYFDQCGRDKRCLLLPSVPWCQWGQTWITWDNLG